MSNLAPVGYIPYSSRTPGVEATWLADALGCRVDLFDGSAASAGIYCGLGIDAQVGEPYGIDCDVFRPRSDFRVALEPLGVTSGPIALFSARIEPDKDLYRLLGAALKAKILFPDLKILIATHVVDPSYVSIVERVLDEERGVHLIL